MRSEGLTAFMVTHNLRRVITYGSRLIMMPGGKIIYDVRGEEKKNLEVVVLQQKFHANITNRMVLN
jgi:putative ABC transport system ATP-binding protein